MKNVQVKLPADFLQSLQKLPSFQQDAFIDAHHHPTELNSIRLNVGKPLRQKVLQNFSQHSPVPWAAEGFYLPQRPSYTFDPFFHAGLYYVQEASSMFIEQIFKQALNLAKPLKILDLCAAPGGKSTHIQSLISPQSLLVSNDVIQSRASILKANMIKWGCNNVVVTNNDPGAFARIRGVFDAIVIDAPCSGSGMFRKDEKAIEEWSMQNVQLCSFRQKRIIADAYDALKTDGILVYATCSYSKEENEDIAAWLIENYALQPVPIDIDESWGIEKAMQDGVCTGFRFWPYATMGEGFFIACFRKTQEVRPEKNSSKKCIEILSKTEKQSITPWLGINDCEFVRNHEVVYAWPAIHVDFLQALLARLKMVYSGNIVGELYHKQISPHHSLAMSNLMSSLINKTDVGFETAIKYLQKNNELGIEAANGWHLITYADVVLGWIKSLPARINNYYPKELRILKDSI